MKGESPEAIEPDYDSAAQAWFHFEITRLMLNHRAELIRAGEEYLRRKKEEEASNG